LQIKSKSGNLFVLLHYTAEFSPGRAPPQKGGPAPKTPRGEPRAYKSQQCEWLLESVCATGVKLYTASVSFHYIFGICTDIFTTFGKPIPQTMWKMGS